VDGGDDLLGVDALQVDAAGAEIGVAELALDHVQRNAFAGEHAHRHLRGIVRLRTSQSSGFSDSTLRSAN
jgi:hypothetical protein